MRIQRRRFLQAALAAPAAPALAAPQSAPPQPAPPPPGPPSPAAYLSQTTPQLATAQPDTAAAPVPGFFSPTQFAALTKLSDLLMPSLDGMPGALDAGVPAFLDFLIGASPAPRQRIYQAGLDALNAQATEHYGKPFAALPSTQADEVLAPLRAPWTYDPPADPLARFLREAKEDVRTATENSRERIASTPPGGRRPRGIGLYWYPIDPLT